MAAAEVPVAPSGPLPGELEDPTDLHASVVGGLKWNTALSAGIQICRFLASLLLVRLLTPDDYGIASMALIYASLGMGLSDLGLGAALIQRPQISEDDRSTVFWTTIMIGFGLMLVGDALAYPTALLFHQPRVTVLLIVASTGFFIGSLGMTQAALMQRAMRFRSLALWTMAATVGASLIAIAVAVAGGGAWALVANPLALGGLMAVMLWTASTWRPRLRYSKASLKDMGGYGANVTGSSILAYVKGNADNLLVGRYLGARALGFYGLAYNVILVPGFRILDPLYNTLFSAVSRIQDDRERIARLWMRAAKGVTGLLAPMMLGLIVVTPDFVDVVLGDRWHDAIPVVRVLALVPLAYSFGVIPGTIVMALNRTRMRLHFAFLDTGLAVAAFVAGLHWGIVGVAVCFTAVVFPQSLLFTILVARMVGLSVARLYLSLRAVVAATAVMVVCCLLCREFMVREGVPAGIRLVTVVLVGAATYALATKWLNPELIAEIENFRSRRKRLEPNLETSL